MTLKKKVKNREKGRRRRGELNRGSKFCDMTKAGSESLVQEIQLELKFSSITEIKKKKLIANIFYKEIKLHPYNITHRLWSLLAPLGVLLFCSLALKGPPPPPCLPMLNLLLLLFLLLLFLHIMNATPWEAEESCNFPPLPCTKFTSTRRETTRETTINILLNLMFSFSVWNSRLLVI